jgi:hypothetical protein
VRERVLLGHAAGDHELSVLALERMLVVLRDYKVLIGYLRSVDQFGELFPACMCGLRILQAKVDSSFLITH